MTLTKIFPEIPARPPPSPKLLKPDCCRAPPPSSRRADGTIIGGRPSRARDHSDHGQRCQILLIVQCSRRHDRFGARAKPSAVSGHHPMTTPMSSGGGECRAGRTLLRWPRRRILAAIRSAPTNHRRRLPGDRPLPHTAPHKLLAQVEHPAGRSRMLVAVHGLAVRSASDAIRAPLTEVVETGLLSRATP